jgi:hypothetical protein
MKKISFCLSPENLVQILPESGSALNPEPDSHSSKMLDTEPHVINADPKHCVCSTVSGAKVVLATPVRTGTR